MSVQGFGPIVGASYKPPVRGKGKIHTISDFQVPKKESDRVDRLAKQSAISNKDNSALVQGFAPETYKPSLSGTGKIHTLSDFRVPKKEGDGINQLAKQGYELTEDQIEKWIENLQETSAAIHKTTEITRKTTEDLRELSARGSRLQKLKEQASELEQSSARLEESSKAMEEDSRKYMKELENLSKNTRIDFVSAFACGIKKIVCWIAQCVYAGFQAILGCLRGLLN